MKINFESYFHASGGKPTTGLCPRVLVKLFTNALLFTIISGMETRTHKSICIVTALCLGASSLVSCSSPASIVSANSLAIDPQDPCRTERTEFSATQDYFVTQKFLRAGVGALTGAVIGGAIGVLLGRGRGALTGAVAGATIGGTAGYYVAMKKLHHSQEELSLGIIQDLNDESLQLRRATAAFRSVAQCRFEQADQIKKSLARDQISVSNADKDLYYEHILFDEEADLARGLGLVISDREKEFKAAAKNLRGDEITKDAISQNINLVLSLASVTIPSLAGNYDRSIQLATGFASLAFDLGARQIRPIDPWPPAGPLPARPPPAGSGPVRQGPLSPPDRPT